MFKRTTVALSLVALLAATGAVFAPQVLAQSTLQPAARANGMGRMKQKLGLTDDQATAVKAAHEKYRDEGRQAWKALHTAQADLRKLALNGADAGTIQAKSLEVQQLTAQTLAVRVKVLQEIGPVLTPEQRAKFADMSMGSHRHHKRGKPAQS